MLKAQFNHKFTKRYADLHVGDIFMVLDGCMDGRIFMYTDHNDDNPYNDSMYNDCVNLTEGAMYNFTADTPIVILQNTQLIVED